VQDLLASGKIKRITYAKVHKSKRKRKKQDRSRDQTVSWTFGVINDGANPCKRMSPIPSRRISEAHAGSARQVTRDDSASLCPVLTSRHPEIKKHLDAIPALQEGERADDADAGGRDCGPCDVAHTEPDGSGV